MKGLLRNNFYSMGTNLQLSFVITAVLIFLPAVTNNKGMIITALAIQCFMFIANVGTALSTDVATKWSNFEITLPVKRNDIIKARYLSFLILVLAGILMAVLTSIFSVLFFETVRKNIIIFGFSLGTSLALMTSALMYPIMLILGTDKNELIIVICTGVTTALLMMFLNIVTPFIPKNLIIDETTVSVLIFTLISLAVFILSYFISVNIYKKKEL